MHLKTSKMYVTRNEQPATSNKTIIDSVEKCYYPSICIPLYYKNTCQYGRRFFL